MDDLIQKLNIFSEKILPVSEVSKFLKNYRVSDEDIKKYCFFQDHVYTRNLVFKNESFEVLLLCWKLVTKRQFMAMKEKNVGQE